jgi:uncharacterized protein
MTDYLLDVNVLVAWGWSDHVHHQRAVSWISTMMKDQKVSLSTSAIPELGFVRVSLQRSGGRLAVSEAAAVLAGMLDSLGKQHRFLADDRSSCSSWPTSCRSAAGTTDAHLCCLAVSHGLKLATLDEGISGAFLLPLK